MDFEKAKEIVKSIDHARFTQWLPPLDIGWCSLEIKRLKDRGIKAVVVRSQMLDARSDFVPVIALVRVNEWHDVDAIKEAYETMGGAL